VWKTYVEGHSEYTQSPAERVGYLATRIVELVVHGDDLASSVGLDWEPPFEAGALAIGILVQIASDQNGAVEVLRVLARSERAGSDIFPVL
jgi:hypothetical protein